MLRQAEPPAPGSPVGPFVLDIINPLTYRDTLVKGRQHKIAYDLTAPLAYLSANADNTWLTGFLQPYREESNAGLHMLEPYQKGKIPLIFVHGLASTPLTWAAMGNELFQHLDLLQEYQFWIFKYPTGKPFVGEAANLREQLLTMRQHLDPEHEDEALDQVVLIGHSMGGLVSKLQITTSGEQLAGVIFKSDIEDLEITPEVRAAAERSLFFEPSPQIRRVIFVGTPHRGSKIASSPVGSLASRLVRKNGSMTENFSEFVKHNQNNISTMWRKLPTSVDLLKPGNPTLETIYHLPVSPSVSMHSIIGVGHHRPLSSEPGDGVVPLSSARHRDVESELLVKAHHDLHHHPETIAEVARILRAHAALNNDSSRPTLDSYVIEEVNFSDEPSAEISSTVMSFSDGQ
jgi:triacylglycerol esterase/lipase EstA (alpha/beta hydrolase family)